MEIVRTINELRNWAKTQRQSGQLIGLVPTMGCLHSGHLSLVDLAREHVDHVVATIFVNPLQFSPQEDFSQYPRNEERDCKLFKSAGVSLLFIPKSGEMYRPDFSTTIEIGKLGAILEGEFRPQFFTGIATVVTKLLIQLLPDIAIFGEKDYQQLCVVKKLVADLDIPVQIKGGKTVREQDGLAISSRNKYLSENERKKAPEIYRAICSFAHEVTHGVDENSSSEIWRKKLVNLGFSKVDYLTVRDSKTLEAVNHLDQDKRALIAAWLGKTRLIDNISF